MQPLDWFRAPFTSACPACGGSTVKALYLGAPLRLCEDETCGCAWGLGADLVALFPVTTDSLEPQWAFAVYDGPWPIALFHWLRGAYDEVED